nr:cilia- and flagella-associated protein 251-like [Labrus bergylta]
MEADLPQSPACSALHSANLKSFNTAREDSIQGFNSFQPPPFSMHSPCSSQTFITACLQSDTTSHTSIAHSTEEEEYRSEEEEEEEGERAGVAEAEQREEDGTSLSRPLVHLEDEEQAYEEEEKSSQTAKESRDEEENMAEQSEEEERVEEGCDEEECVKEGSDEEHCVVERCDGEECVDEYTGEKERDEEYSDEDERVVGGSDEEESVAGSSDEDERVEEEWVEKGSDEDEAGLCHPQREVSSGVEEEGPEDEADDRRKVTSGLFDQETAGGTGLLPGSQKKKEHLMESQQSLLEDTTRAHSTLDDVLQEFECEEERESPGARRDGKIL